MANAKKCDRCGAYYQEVEATAIEALAKSMTSIFEAKIPKIIEMAVDLCPSCCTSLKRWWNEKEGTDGN